MFAIHGTVLSSSVVISMQGLFGDILFKCLTKRHDKFVNLVWIAGRPRTVVMIVILEP